MNRYRRIPGKYLSMILLVTGMSLASGNAAAQGNKIDAILGTYSIFTTTNQQGHENGVITVVQSSKNPRMYGIVLVTDQSGNDGEGLMCNDALLLPNDTALACSIEETNPLGRITFSETLIVASIDSLYCTALRNSLPNQAQKDKVVDGANDECNEEGEECVCYTISHRGNSNAGPPSQGTGSGSRG